MTPEERNRAAIARAHRDIWLDFKSAVRPLYSVTPAYRPRHAGSCVLVVDNGIRYLVTAAHVIDEAKDSVIYIGTDDGFVELVGDWFLTDAPDGDRNEDQIDIAVARLGNSTLCELGDMHFIPPESCLLDGLPNDQPYSVALGWPSKLNENFDAAKRSVKPEAVSFLSSRESNDTTIIRMGGDVEHNCLLAYHPKWAINAVGDKERTGVGLGMSGGALFLAPDVHRSVAQLPGWRCQGKLIGVLIERDPNRRVLFFTQVRMILAEMRAVETGQTSLLKHISC